MISSISFMDILFSLASLLTGGLMLVAGVAAVISLRGFASVVFLVGTIMGFINGLVWIVFPFLQGSGGWEPGGSFIMVLRVFGTFSWMVTAVGVLMVVFVAVGLRRQNQALESIMAGSQTDRVA